jgi:hypothetical protein
MAFKPPNLIARIAEGAAAPAKDSKDLGDFKLEKK